MTRVKIKGLRKVFGDLNKLFSPDVIFNVLSKSHETSIVKAVIGSAKNGIGPDNKIYTARKGDKINSRWLYSDNKSQHMLDKNRFSIAFQNGKIYLKWKALNGEQAQYAAVHQGPERGGERNRLIPARPWLHFENEPNQEALITAYEKTLAKLTSKFNSGEKI